MRTTALSLILLAASSAVGQTGPRELRGELFSVENGDQNPKLLAGVQVTLREFGNSDVSNDGGVFRIALPPGAQPGQEATLRQDKKGYAICSPLYGKLTLPADGKLVEVRMLPSGSKLFWTHERIEEFIARTASDAARQPKGPEAGETDLSSYLAGLGQAYGFTPEQVRAEIAKWIEQAKKDATDFRKQGMAAFAEKNFRLAAENFRRSAEGKVQRAAEALRDAARDFELAGDSSLSAQDSRPALEAFERASRSLAAYRDGLGAPKAEAYPEYPADVRRLTLKSLLAKSQLGYQLDGPEGRRQVEEAEAGFRRLIAEVPRSLDPQTWAMAQFGLATTLAKLAEREPGVAGARHQAEVTDAIRAAMEVFTREYDPQRWATLQTVLGSSLTTRGMGEPGAGGARDLDEAAEHARGALEILKRAEQPQQWAQAKTGLGMALALRGLREPGAGGARYLAEAADALRDAQEVLKRGEQPQYWALSQTMLGSALAERAGREPGAEGGRRLAEAADTLRAALGS